MTKDIGPWALIAIAFNVCNSWAGLTGTLNISLFQGGPVALVYGLLLSSSLYGCIALTIAELACAYPTAGGQYHFVSILAPIKFCRSLSYTCGMITNFSWIATGAAINMIFSEELMTLIMFNHPDFIPHPWHQFLFYQAVFLCISVFFGSFLAILIRSSPRASSQFVWTTFINQTGWPDGVCFITSLLTPCFIYSGLDAALHLAEEVPNPRVAVPQACLSAVTIGFLTSFVYLIAVLYTIVDLDSIRAFDGFVVHLTWILRCYTEKYNRFLPFELSRQALRSDGGAVAILILSIGMTFFILNAVLQTASWLTWALAKDNALMFSDIIQKVHPHLGVPISSLIFNTASMALCGCIYLASSTGMRTTLIMPMIYAQMLTHPFCWWIAFNAIIGSCVVLQQLSYLMPTILLIYRQRSEEFLPRDRTFRLRAWIGWLVNIWVLIVTSTSMPFFFLPPFLPVSASTMSKFVACAIPWSQKRPKEKNKNANMCKTIIVL
ncbi:hypothetical protein MKX08_002835 [Trichoderma sp. CBMAI-0020]|nr:hypothetical protein MKX08_002835 [Trichoderma sp. CBMAI-0020]